MLSWWNDASVHLMVAKNMHHASDSNFNSTLRTYIQVEIRRVSMELLWSWRGNYRGYYMPGPSNYPLLDSKYHQIRTIRFQLRVVGRSR